MSFFNSKTAAERYLAGRPDFHGEVIDHARAFLSIDQKLPAALDVGCGTGLSAKALLEIAEEVYGTDISEEMLNLAYAKNRIHYVTAPAEALPFEDGKFDLVTVSSAVHWFDIDAFLMEAHRVLKPKGWLLIYMNYFTSKMDGNDDFLKWADGVHYKKFPTPPRNNTYDWSAENLGKKGFSIYTADEFENGVYFDKRQLIDYLTTQSNVEAAVKQTSIYSDIEAWLDKELSLYFSADGKHLFWFGNRLNYLQKIIGDE